MADEVSKPSNFSGAHDARNSMFDIVFHGRNVAQIARVAALFSFADHLSGGSRSATEIAEAANPDASAAGQDLNLLVCVGGKERTRDEYSALLRSSELRIVKRYPTRSFLSILEATPA